MTGEYPRLAKLIAGSVFMLAGFSVYLSTPTLKDYLLVPVEEKVEFRKNNQNPAVTERIFKIGPFESPKIKIKYMYSRSNEF